jgi:hypothetical protein
MTPWMSNVNGYGHSSVGSQKPTTWTRTSRSCTRRAVASVPILTQPAADAREHRAVGSLAFRIHDSLLRDPRADSGYLVQPGRHGGWRAPAAARAVTALLVGAAWRGGRRVLPAAHGRRPRLAVRQASRAPPAPQPA